MLILQVPELRKLRWQFAPAISKTVFVLNTYFSTDTHFMVTYCVYCKDCSRTVLVLEVCYHERWSRYSTDRDRLSWHPPRVEVVDSNSPRRCQPQCAMANYSKWGIGKASNYGFQELPRDKLEQAPFRWSMALRLTE